MTSGKVSMVVRLLSYFYKVANNRKNFFFFYFFFQAEDGIRDYCLSRGLGDVYKGQVRDELTPECVLLCDAQRLVPSVVPSVVPGVVPGVVPDVRCGAQLSPIHTGHFSRAALC